MDGLVMDVEYDSLVTSEDDDDDCKEDSRTMRIIMAVSAH